MNTELKPKPLKGIWPKGTIITWEHFSDDEQYVAEDADQDELWVTLPNGYQVDLGFYNYMNRESRTFEPVGWGIVVCAPGDYHTQVFSISHVRTKDVKRQMMLAIEHAMTLPAKNHHAKGHYADDYYRMYDEQNWTTPHVDVVRTASEAQAAIVAGDHR